MSIERFRAVRRTLVIRSSLLCLAAGLATGAAMAQPEQGFPSKPVRIVVSFPPGGAADALGRTLAKGLQAVWGQPVLVENLPGASGSIGAERVVRAAPDGTTLYFTAEGPLTVLPFTRDKLPYDPLTDLTPVAMTSVVPNMLVVAGNSRYKSFKELVAAAKAAPGTLNYASSGKGESHMMAMEYMMGATGTRFNEIPYKGGAPAVLAVTTGEVQAAWLAVGTAQPFLKSGQLIGLAVSTRDRVPQVPDVPSVAELGYPGFDFAFWMGLLAPANMPPALVRKLEADIQTVVNSPGYRDSVRQLGILPRYEGKEQFTKTLRDTYLRNQSTLTR
jgi:tripartite-type tricarboxylate transporter receptor subunit TctC